ncbi:MAG: nitrous oxide-stimulated promoter family protein [Bacteroidales bacterium]|nr:nitrous oxide-stimulated promoter family protein [Bacteroidales bacterium]MCM1148326.1 nitrous oxide-stimulated promoter family protein [Bacteroidales bacterium]MCM1206982.1 nitrous oxide-stimulated promoter family protein [Bacillota bacterium]MCM1511278.1 nitrous oxide-stimulated promoter family protein [Clostridium sp.]
MANTTTRIAREKYIVRLMIGIYCNSKHQCNDELCKDCMHLYEYACSRLDGCRFGERKPSCRKCYVHCYRPDMREQIRHVMRYVGPRMLWHHPIAAIRHLAGK